jgi:thiamine pyrophosphokinase
MDDEEPVTLVVASSDHQVPRALVDLLPVPALVVAADSGLEHARSLGLRVDVVVGDFDSVDPDLLDEARRAGVTIEEHPAEKDATDLELALDAAVARGARRITVVGGAGGRLDHLLANTALLGASRFAGVVLDAWLGTARLVVVRDHATVTGKPGSLCTLLAVDGPARGVTTKGLKYPLSDDVLQPGSTRGVSNELVDTSAHVSVSDGTLVLVQPHALED